MATSRSVGSPPTDGAGDQVWEAVARLVEQWADRLAERLRATVPELRVRVRHHHVRSAIEHGSWVELSRDAAARDTDDVLVELLFVPTTRVADLTVYEGDDVVLVDEELPFDPAAGTEQTLAVTRRALDLVDGHLADIAARLR
jgi:hypothetical protein